MAVPEPVRARPRFPASYGISPEDEGMLSWEWARERLVAARNYWVGTTRPDGSPHVAPVWGLWLDDGFYFGTSPSSRKGRNVRRDPRVVVHLESGDEAVILEGELEPVRLDDRIADAYGVKYAFRPEPAADGGEGWYRLRPRVGYAWAEENFPRTATRFEFPAA